LFEQIHCQPVAQLRSALIYLPFRVSGENLAMITEQKYNSRFHAAFFTNAETWAASLSLIWYDMAGR
jgi:hypothetical protein